MRRQKRASCTDTDYKKMANLGDKGNFGKNDGCAKNSSRVWPNMQMRRQKVAC